jgi:uncharacterized protein YndB with AHSA1/START domain
MAVNNERTSSTADREIVITRLLDAPRELVFRVWTDPAHVGQWWGPQGFTTTVHEMTVKPGGVWRLTMHGPDGVDYPCLIVYHEVVEPELLAYTLGSGAENDPGTEVTVTFLDEQDGKTRLTMRSLFQTAEARNFVVEKHHAIEGGNQTVDRFVEKLAEVMAEGLKV